MGIEAPALEAPGASPGSKSKSKSKEAPALEVPVYSK